MWLDVSLRDARVFDKSPGVTGSGAKRSLTFLEFFAHLVHMYYFYAHGEIKNFWGRYDLNLPAHPIKLGYDSPSDMEPTRLS